LLLPPSISLPCLTVSVITYHESRVLLNNADGTFIAYVKAGRGYDDAFIAIMRVGLLSFVTIKLI
jgi:hypothetical protein